ncbi:MAG: hypothetical protein KAS72_11440 [Phycisphaerales bacterium]|nr:hypothetical protein [Phycisphaerales bacterium]
MKRSRFAAGAAVVLSLFAPVWSSNALAAQHDRDTFIPAEIGEDGRPIDSAKARQSAAIAEQQPKRTVFPPALPEDGSDAVGPPSPTAQPAALRPPRVQSKPVAEFIPASECLSGLSARQGHASQVEVELPADISAEVRERGDLIASLWKEGRCDEALTLLDSLEKSGISPAVGVSPGLVQPPASLQTRGVPVRLDGKGRDLPPLYAIDYDAQTGNIFAALACGSQWTMKISYDDGASWTQTFEWHGTDIIDLDLAVVGDWAYVLYADAGLASEMRLRRFFVADGMSDSDYGSKVVCDVSSDTIREVALVTNADDSDNGLYCFCLTSSNTIRYLWGSSGGGMFTDASPSLGNVLGGLDAHWNDDHDTYFLFMSYIGMEGNLHVWRRGDGAWSECHLTPFTGANVRTALTAYDETVFCAVEHMYSEDYGIRAYINYEAGSGLWYANNVAEPPGQTPFVMADASARGGGGIAVTYQQDLTWVDYIIFRNRHTYSYSPWNDPVILGNTIAGTWTAINWLPPLSNGNNAFGYGILYEWSNAIYFHREDGYEANTGDNCSDPIVIQIPDDLPYTDVNATCDRVNDYDDTYMDTYDDGEDIIYELVVPHGSIVDFSLTADSPWAGMAVFDHCSDSSGPYSGLAMAASMANPDVIENLCLQPGSYYIMVDTYPPPDCTNFELTITEEPFEETCPDGAIFSQSPHSAANNYTAGVSDWHWSDGQFLRRFEHFEAGENVSALRWWGLQAFYSGVAWEPCDESPMEFAIAFYYDYGGVAGDMVSLDIVEVYGVDTGYTYSNDLVLYRYDVVLPSPCALAEGWVSIMGVSEPEDCWFAWMSSPDGDGVSGASYNGVWETALYDLSICLMPVADCPGDLNGDGQRDQADLGILLASYGLDDGGDCDGDGDTDQADLGILLANYGNAC